MPRTPRGFTLVELLVVLAIIALMLSAAPVFFAGLPGVRLRAAADDLAATLRQLHDAAIRGRTTTGFMLDPVTGTYHLSTVAGAERLPEIVTRVDYNVVAFRPDGRAVHILFYADGSASGGTIRLQHDDLSASIQIDWLTGRVGRHD